MFNNKKDKGLSRNNPKSVDDFYRSLIAEKLAEKAEQAEQAKKEKSETPAKSAHTVERKAPELADR